MASQIVGISLVRNEDLFISQAITNVTDFCDKIIILDNCSTDNTWREIEGLKAAFPHVEAYKINDYRQSHNYIADYAGTNTWILGVDGDEIYDPKGLSRLRKDIFSGKFDDVFLILGNVVHCEHLDVDRLTARGYSTPESRSMTKLFNFSAFDAWPGPGERLHAKNRVFANGYGPEARYVLYEVMPWNDSPFRAIHLCFVKRSSIDSSDVSNRLQPGELPAWLKMLDRLHLGQYFMKIIQKRQSSWKSEKYRRGDIVSVDVKAFFSIFDNV